MTIPALWHTFRFILNLGLLYTWEFKDDFKHISFIKLEIANLLGNAGKKFHSNFTHLLLSFYLSVIGLYHSGDLYHSGCWLS